MIKIALTSLDERILRQNAFSSGSPDRLWKVRPLRSQYPAAAGSARGHTEEGGAAEEAADAPGPPALLREWVARTGAATYAAESRKH